MLKYFESNIIKPQKDVLNSTDNNWVEFDDFIFIKFLIFKPKSYSKISKNVEILLSSPFPLIISKKIRLNKIINIKIFKIFYCI